MKLLVLLLLVTGVISSLAAQKDPGARLVFFELTVSDLERAKTFYRQLFGWSFTESPSPEFVSIQGAGIAGGMLKVSNKTSGKGRVKIFLEVENVGTTLKRARNLGGEVLVPETQISPSRTLAEFRDPEGNVIGIMHNAPSAPREPGTPNIESQRESMQKLSFLVGSWSGQAVIFRPTGEELHLLWTEDADYKLDGLLLMIEAAGRNTPEGKIVRQALGFISFDDLTGVYRMRAYNDGQWLETELSPLKGGHSFSWGFTSGEIRTGSILRIDEKGQWTELHEMSIGSQPPRKFMELTVRKTQDRK